ncbi:HlyD family secretion protein [Nautilia lithotrophica]
MNKKNIIFIVVISLLAVSAYLIYKKLNPKKLPPYLIEAVGKIDGDLININTKYPGRIIKLNVDTGDLVKKGEILAVLDSKEFKDKLNALNYEIKAKENELAFMKNKINSTIKKAKTAIDIKQKELNSLYPQIDSLKALIAQDKKDEKRIKSLVKRKLAKPHELELAILKTKTDINKLNSLLQKEKALKLAVDIAKEDLKTAIASKENIKALNNAINALKAKRNELSNVINELTLYSPVNGYVDAKLANVGEVVGAGMPVVSVIDPKSYYLSVYIDEINNGKVRLGDKAVIFLDSFPDKPIEAVVSKISKKAEFTPKEVAVRSDRITRVYEVRLKPLSPCKYFKLGLPATGVILTGNGSLPKSLDELPEL